MGTAGGKAGKVLLVPTFWWVPRAETLQKCSWSKRFGGDHGQKRCKSAPDTCDLQRTAGGNTGKVLLVQAFWWGPRAETQGKCSWSQRFGGDHGLKHRKSALGTIVGRHQPEMSGSPTIYVHITLNAGCSLIKCRAPQLACILIISQMSVPNAAEMAVLGTVLITASP